MRKRIVINADPHETRIAILEDNELVELLVERGDKRRHVGDIYKGRVNAVLRKLLEQYGDTAAARVFQPAPLVRPDTARRDTTARDTTRTRRDTTFLLLHPLP